MSIKKYIATQQIIDCNSNTPKEEPAPTYLTPPTNLHVASP
jgi:hypothetical protein